MFRRHARPDTIGLIGAVLLLHACTASVAPADLLWEAEYDGSGNDIAYDLAVAPDGSAVYTVGRSMLDTFDFATAAFDPATGAELWSQRFDAGRREYAVAAKPAADGAALYVTGPSFHETQNFNFETIAYDAKTGKVIWTNEYDDPNHVPDRPTSMAIAPDGSIVYVSGVSGAQDRRDWRTLALSTEDGSVLWSRQYGTRRHFEWPGDVVAAAGGSSIFVTGSEKRVDQRGHDLWNGATIAYQARTGDLLWKTNVKRFTGYRVAPSPDGTTVFLVGSIMDSRGFVDYMTIGLSSSTGEIEWRRRYSTDLGWEQPSDLAIGPDGNVYVTGYAENETTTLAYSASGQQLWKAMDPIPFGDPEIAVSTDGATVYLALRPSNEEIGTIAYDAVSGGQIWSRRVMRDSIGAGRDLSLGLAPDGSTVFTAGSGFSAEGDFDFTAIAYTT
jgi:outer membrane protein assembly factor BamB